MDNQDSTIERREQCPQCLKNGNDSSGDNLIVYSNGGKHCFACDFTIISDDYREETDTDIIYEHEDRLVFSTPDWAAIKEYTTTEGNNFRGIDDETYAFFGVRHEYNIGDGELLKQYYPLTNNDNRLCGVKIRCIPKKFFCKGSNKYISTELFGQAVHRKSTAKYVIVCSGELDALSAYQMLKYLGTNCPAIVSSTVGENGFRQYQSQYEFLNKFEKIIVIPDKDDAGQKAMKKLSQVMPRDKLFIVDLPRKDTNEMLMDPADLKQDFIDRVFKAKPYIPDGIVGSSQLHQALLETTKLKRIPLPPFMHKLEDILAGGITLESIVNLVAASGIGKSSYANELIYYWIFNSPYKVGIVSLELSAGQYANALLSRHLGNKLNLMRPEELQEYLITDEVMQKSDELFKSQEGIDRFYLIEDRSSKLESAKKLIEQLIIGCNCKVIVLDPLQDLLAGCSLDEQSLFMSWQKITIKLYGVVFVNICHTRKSGDTANSGSTGAMISEEDILGSSDIYKSASINLLLTRNKLAENDLERNTTKMWLSKNRNTGVTGDAGSFIYDNQTHTLFNEEDHKSLFPERYIIDLPDNVQLNY